MDKIANKMPDRFRSLGPGEVLSKAKTAPETKRPLTLPVGPKLNSDRRAAINPKKLGASREELEEQELEDMKKKHQFKARPFRRETFGVGGEKGVFRPHRSEKKLTLPTPFSLSTDGRANSRPASPFRTRDDEELSKQFKARPMPTHRSSSVGRARPRTEASDRRTGSKEVTVAESPMLSTKRRSAIRGSLGGVSDVVKSSEELEMEEVSSQFKARPMPNYSRM
ncbi:unnamed protein product, partial [Choristocarpus tenellus]